ncbi:MAG: LysR family transcriptional regulator [Gammaproteobacteria bacterium]|jgi:DNA-binding transcriptional LysR family regulator|uniref:DNA-binding transcriptional regulator, LysR family n=1 Tax=Marinomonas polaris DSM 16579 TaxID=1122206 RepID=A0A1M5H7X8_9GAMM|nr:MULTISPECIES: LysR family transcriptional regulator [Marinomonas]MBU1297462.1 LysR family transcriptional regulator [Gammaproteobacteria bacterium]MBU1466267.1 LysR family transcriptional regulator [Gammaproteobacteria bacterium]MBU2020854.1 LysR family transcriptional regulator [Gammaproteobacteria bacterium]MBU2318862.1 LysR family transcriptional regulator [Gammaproteobacteria bacterium]MBU2414590.1 LysR family transcriptional regulator [Gammaproteobacteria bacterium]|tara:strand:- start:12116 stop:13048 length:933 start_codon:yes stop_codon:yes gene_type:complete
MIPSSLQHLDLKSLTGLLYLLEERNVGRAADRLYLSQSAMSRLLNRLRDAFDDPLFIRTSKGMVPTSKALALEAPLKLMLEQLAGLWTESEFQPQSSYRTFRMQTTHYQAQAYMPAIAEQFYREAPFASLETSTLTETSLLNQAEHSLDLALCSDYIQLPNSFEKHLLGREKFRCVMSANHALAMKDNITLDDYLAYSHVLVNLGGSNPVISDALLGERARERHFAFRTPYMLAALETVGRTSLLMSNSGLLPERFQQQFGLVIKDLPMDFPFIHYYSSWPKSVENDPGVIWFRDICERVVKGLIPYPEP